MAPLILLPGMGADRRVLKPQLAAFANLVVPDWIDPEGAETLNTYAARFARQIDPGVPCFIGGVSFGSVVALEMARHLRAIACFLIAGLSDPAALPWRVRVLRPLAGVAPDALIRVMAAAARGAWPVLRPILGPTPRTLLEQFGSSQPSFMGWAGRQMLSWHPSTPPLEVPVYHIHGAADHILPARRSGADLLVPGAGHVLTLTHAPVVNEYLRTRMEMRLHERA